MQALRSKLTPFASRVLKTTVRNHGGPHIPANAPTVQITFINPHPSQVQKDGPEQTLTVDARIGETFLQTAHRHDIDLEGACEGVCACSTCHIVLSDEVFDTLEEPSEDEEDMLGTYLILKHQNIESF